MEIWILFVIFFFILVFMCLDLVYCCFIVDLNWCLNLLDICVNMVLNCVICNLEFVRGLLWFEDFWRNGEIGDGVCECWGFGF